MYQNEKKKILDFCAHFCYSLPAKLLFEFTVSIRKERPGDIGGGQLYRPGDNLLDLNENPTLSPGR